MFTVMLAVPPAASDVLDSPMAPDWKPEPVPLPIEYTGFCVVPPPFPVVPPVVPLPPPPPPAADESRVLGESPPPQPMRHPTNAATAASDETLCMRPTR